MSSFEKTIEVWRVFEELVDSGKVKFLGISNCYDVDFFKKLFHSAKVKPTFLQNRFYQDSGYDKELRQFCKGNSVHYQSFWTLTANPHILHSATMKALVSKYKLSAEQILYMVLMGEDIIPLIGTCSKKHMEEDLAMLGKKIEEGDRKSILEMLK